MIHHPRDPERSGESNDDLARALRELFAPPAGESYWPGLEARILARIASAPQAEAGAEPGWWMELTTWVRPALVAAAVLLLCAAAAVLQSRRAEQRLAYEAILVPTPVPAETAIRPSLQDDREATLRFLLTP